MPNEDFGKQGGISYRDAGVDINAGSKLVDRIGPTVKATQNTDLQLSSIGGFAALTQLPAHYKQPVLVSGTDGVGTKLELAEKFELEVDQTLKELSKGNRQKVALILAVLHKPKALILDEPTSGLDPFHQRTFFEIVKEFANNGAAILLSSHIISEVEKVADSMAVLREGAKVYDETYETFLNKAKEEGQDLEDAFFTFYDRREG